MELEIFTSINELKGKKRRTDKVSAEDLDRRNKAVNQLKIAFSKPMEKIN